MKAIGYIRVSTQLQAEEGLSLEAQQAKIETYAVLHRLDLISIQQDAGISGKRADNRPGLQTALAMACKHKAALIVYSISRLSRDRGDIWLISERLQRFGTTLISLTEKIDDKSAIGEFYFSIVASMAQFERKQISERTKMAMAHKMSQNESTGRIPYGYRLDEDGVHLAPEPSQQIILGAILSRRREGATDCTIRDELNAAGVPTMQGSRWARSTIYLLRKREARRNQLCNSLTR